ncbi:MAG TPA: NAD(+) diphosphatase [Oleiagrimonas sp.]|nr:NAD(+) diphosphatase [Oleiagrimonas sp.]
MRLRVIVLDVNADPIVVTPGAISHPLNPFAGSGLDRAAEHRDDAAWLAAREASPDSRFMLLDADYRLLVDATGEPRWLSADERSALVPDVPASLLGVADGRTWFVLHTQAVLPAALNDGPPSWADLRRDGLAFDAFTAGLFAYARGLVHWQDMTRFCRHCGSPLVRVSAGHRAQCTSSTCGHLHFPRTDAAVIVIVEHDGACLMGRQSSWPEGRYSTLAGFVEPGETLEDAVRREVYEEAGVEVGACHYHSSQPWPFPASLMVGFTAEALGRDITLRDGELQDARWFTPEDIVAGIRDGTLLPSSRISVSWRLQADWLRERAGIDLAALTR